MRWLIRRHGHYWPTILSYFKKYAKGCQACQKHGPVQHVPASELPPILKTSRLDALIPSFTLARSHVGKYALAKLRLTGRSPVKALIKLFLSRWTSPNRLVSLSSPKNVLSSSASVVWGKGFLLVCLAYSLVYHISGQCSECNHFWLRILSRPLSLRFLLLKDIRPLFLYLLQLPSNSIDFYPAHK